MTLMLIGGDGTTEHYDNASVLAASHTYIEGNAYVARIVGVCNRLTYKRDWDTATKALRPYLTHVDIENDSPLEWVEGTFARHEHLVSVDEDVFRNCRTTISLRGVFHHNFELEGVQSGIFDACDNVSSVPDVYWGDAKLTTGVFNLWNSPTGNTRELSGCSSLSEFYLKNVPDADALTRFFNSSKPPTRPADQRGTIHLCRHPDPKYDTALMEVLPEHQALANAKNWDIIVDPVV